MAKLHVASRGPIVLQIQKDIPLNDGRRIGTRRTIAYFAKGRRLTKQQDDYACNICDETGHVERSHRATDTRCNMCSGKGFTRTAGKWIERGLFEHISPAVARELQRRRIEQGWRVIVAAPESSTEIIEEAKR